MRWGGNKRFLAAAAALVVLSACGSSNTPSAGSVSTVSLKIMVGGLNKQDRKSVV